jgi:hypothetical protein
MDGRGPRVDVAVEQIKCFEIYPPMLYLKDLGFLSWRLKKNIVGGLPPLM